MKKLINLFFGISLSLYGQSSINPDLVTFPISPEAARLGSYGNTPVNLFSGQIQQSIPLFEGKEGDYDLPVSLNYNYAGYRVEETPSLVGLGWSLNLGGVVVREVRGVPDEYHNGYSSNVYIKEHVLNPYFNSGTISDMSARKIALGEYDSEPDKYTLSVNGISFSFKIGIDGNPVFLSKHNYKLQIIRDPNNNLNFTSFILTDTNANKYFFEYKETNEHIESPAFYSNVIYDLENPIYTSSWQLSKIILNNDLQITYGYEDDDFYTYNFFATGIFRGFYVTQLPDSEYSQGCAKDLVRRKILTSITSNSFNIRMNLHTLNGEKVYSGIEIRDFHDNIVDAYIFTYATLRNELINITHNNTFFHGFEYYGNIAHGFINSITQFPWNQDKWGFANDAFNSYGVDIPLTSYIADKSVSFTKTVNGALKKITYPTKGTTEFEYEQNTIAPIIDENTVLNSRIHLKFKSDNLPSAPIYKEKIFTKTFETDVLATLSHSLTTINNGFVYLSITRDPTCGSVTNGNHNYFLKIPGIRSLQHLNTPTVCPLLEDAITDDNPTSPYTINRDSDGKFFIPAGTYIFKFSSDSNQYDVRGEMILDFYDPSVGDMINQDINEKVGGIRVKSITDDPIDGEPITRFFDYNDDDNHSTGKSFGKLYDIKYYKERHTWDADPDPDSWWVKSEETSSQEYSAKSYNMLLNSGVPVYYERVREFTSFTQLSRPIVFSCTTCSAGYQSFNYDTTPEYSNIGSNGPTYTINKKTFPMGYKQYVFNSIGIASEPPTFTPKGNDLSKGSLAESSVYAKSDNDLQNELLQSDEKTYYFPSNDPVVTNNNWQELFENPNYPKGLRVAFKLKRSGILYPYTSSETIDTFFWFDIYKEFDSESLLQTTKTKEYFNGQFIERSSVIEYNSHQQQKTITSVSGIDVFETKEIFYPHDFSDATSSKMVDANCISPIVKVVKKKNDAVIETTQFDYDELSASLFRPEYFLKSKRADALEKIKRFSYDSKGRVKGVQRVIFDPPSLPESLSEPKTIVIWGYRESTIIAKIECPNSFTLPLATVFDLQTKSDADIDSCSDYVCYEGVLRQALDALRTTYPELMINTYTHDPLVGITSITDPKGYVSYYQYDPQGRLVTVKDKDGNILSENQYHYKP